MHTVDVRSTARSQKRPQLLLTHASEARMIDSIPGQILMWFLVFVLAIVLWGAVF